MSHEVFRLYKSLFNAPQLICPNDYMHIMHYLETRNSPDYDHGKAKADLFGSSLKGRREPEFIEESKVGVIDMSGPITYKPVVGLSVGENLNHIRIIEEAEQLLDLGATTIVLEQNSGGGEASHTFETAVNLRELCDDYGARLIAYVDTISASASYAYSAVAHEIVMNPDAEVGSIGVLIRLRNFNKALKKEGIEDTYITAGESKIPFDEDGEWSEDFKAGLQESVDSLYKIFTDHVAMWRGLSVEDVVNTKAKMFSADKALDLGLADSIMTVKEFREYLNQEGEAEQTQMFKTKARKEETQDMAKLEELQGQVASLQEQLEGKVAELTASEEIVAKLTEELSETKASLEDITAKFTQLEETSKAEKLAARKEKLENLIGTDRASSMAGVYEEMSDEQFTKLCSGLGASLKEEEESILCKELGDEGDKDSEVVSYRTAGDILREQLNKTKGAN